MFLILMEYLMIYLQETLEPLELLNICKKQDIIDNYKNQIVKTNDEYDNEE